MSGEKIVAPPAGGEKVSAKISRLLTAVFALWLILLLAPSVKKTAAEAKRAAPAVKAALERYGNWSEGARRAPAAIPVLALGCADLLNNPESLLPDAREAVVIVPPLGDCPTQWQNRPEKTTRFVLTAYGKVDVQYKFSDEEISGWKTYDPALPEKKDYYYWKYIKAARFRNAYGTPARVEISMY